MRTPESSQQSSPSPSAEIAPPSRPSAVRTPSSSSSPQPAETWDVKHLARIRLLDAYAIPSMSQACSRTDQQIHKQAHRR